MFLGTPRVRDHPRRMGDPRTNAAVYAIAIIRYRRPLEEILAGQDEHRAYLRTLHEAGTLLAAGPMDPRSGGMLLLRVSDTDAAAAGFVFVGRADAAIGGADGGAVLARLRHLLHQPVEREYHVRAIRDAQLPANVDAVRFKRSHLLNQRGQVHHHAVANYGLHARAQNAARDQLENKFLFTDVNGMAGIMPALVARDNVKVFGEKVDNLAFSFVAPLRT